MTCKAVVNVKWNVNAPKSTCHVFTVLCASKNQALENNYEVIFREPDTRWKFNVQELARYLLVFLVPHSVSCCFQVFQTEQKHL